MECFLNNLCSILHMESICSMFEISSSAFFAWTDTKILVLSFKLLYMELTELTYNLTRLIRKTLMI